MKPMSPDVHQALAGWVKAGGVLVFVDADRDPYNRVKSWWNSDAAHAERIPRQALFTALGLGEGTKDGLHAVGQGALLYDAASPAALARDPGGGGGVRDLVRKACARAGLEYREADRIVLRRGPYVIAAGREGSGADGPGGGELKGRYIDLFDAELPVVGPVRIDPERRALLYDLDRAQAAPAILASACRLRGLSRRGGGLEFVAAGPDRTECVLRMKLTRAPGVTTVDGWPLDEKARSWDADSMTLRLRFDNSADGRRVLVE
jgi:hypothetical protein